MLNTDGSFQHYDFTLNGNDYRIISVEKKDKRYVYTVKNRTTKVQKEVPYEVLAKWFEAK
jgi:hypothetical protein